HSTSVRSGQIAELKEASYGPDALFREIESQDEAITATSEGHSREATFGEEADHLGISGRSEAGTQLPSLAGLGVTDSTVSRSHSHRPHRVPLFREEATLRRVERFEGRARRRAPVRLRNAFFLNTPENQDVLASPSSRVLGCRWSLSRTTND